MHLTRVAIIYENWIMPNTSMSIELSTLKNILSDEIFFFPSNSTYEVGKSYRCAKRKLYVPITTDVTFGNDYAVLEELDPLAKLKSVKLKGIDRTKTLILKADHFTLGYFKAETWCKACDFLVLTEHGRKKYALFIDLKTSVEDDFEDNCKLKCNKSDYNTKIIWQMLGADALFDGLIDVVSKVNSSAMRDTKANKTQSANSELASYKRRYVILYLKANPINTLTSGSIARTGVLRKPNLKSLESDVLALDVLNDGCTVDVGDFFSRGVAP